MSKAMMIIDMPESCAKCEYHDIRLDSTIRCIVCKAHMGEGAPKSGRADWCPLREVSKKIDYASHFKEDSQSIDFSVGYTKGYNTCIDEILKEN